MLPESCFVSTKIHTRSIKIGDGSMYPFCFRELTGSDIIEYRRFFSSDDPMERRKSVAFLISTGLVTEDGSRAVTMEEAMQLKPGVADRFSNTILELSGFGDAKNA